MSRELNTVARCSHPDFALNKCTKAKTGRAVVIIAASLALTGCYSAKDQSLYTSSINSPVHSERHPISVRTGAVELRIEVSRHMAAMRSGQRIKMSSFVENYKSVGAGPMRVSIPRGSGNRRAVSNVVADVSQTLRAMGVPSGAVVIKRYRARSGRRNPPVLLRYQRYYAKASPCGNWPGNVGTNYHNKPYPNFACAQQNNLAAMVANPRDLIAPRAVTPGDIRRRMTVYGKYIKGEVTSADRSSDEKSTVANVGSN